MIAITMVIIFGSFSTAATLATRTYQHIWQTTTLSTKHRTAQYTLLIAVCAQVEFIDWFSYKNRLIADVCAARMRVHSLLYVYYVSISESFRQGF